MDSFATPPRPARAFTDNVIPCLLEWRREGVAAALVTLTGVDGSSPRRVGSQMAVDARGRAVGAISSGCAEAAIIAEAVAALGDGQPRLVRYGKGSPFMDVVLPCGSGIDVHIDPTFPMSALEQLADAMTARGSATLAIDLDLSSSARVHFGPAPFDAPTPRTYLRSYVPPVRLMLAGRGALVDYLARFAFDLEWDVVVASPDANQLSRLAPFVADAQHLTSPRDFASAAIDARTALVLAFHDHEWEPAILTACRDRTPFYIGALGSRAAHAQRLGFLASLGYPDGLAKRIQSPVGLDLGAATPPAIALSIAAAILLAAPQDTKP